MTSPDSLKAIDDFPSLVAYLREELDWEIPDLPQQQLTYSYRAEELGLKLDAKVEITQLRPILGQQNPWGVFFVDFDKAELPVTLLRRILSSVSRRKRESANPGDRALFDKNDLLFVSAFGKADDRRLALAHFHQEPNSAALPTLRVLTWDRQDTPRHMATVAERLERLRWPDGRQLEEAWKARWAGAFVDRPRDGIRTAKEMAEALAECAKQIRQAIQEILPKERPGQPLGQLFEAVKATLNKDLDVPKFADTYAQTIAYGLLSKRIDQVQRWRAEKAHTLNGALPLPSITVDALETAIPTNPFLSELLNSFLAAGGRDRVGAGLDFDELGLGDVIDLLNTANMEAVLDDFDKDKRGDDPVIHFYEGFLAAYDKAMKVQRGVFYTPKPVVSFIVHSLDKVLRTEFGLPLGLADTTTWREFVKNHAAINIPEGVGPEDPFVTILDPATGTGTFLVEVIDLIYRRMTEEAWKDKTASERRELWNTYVAEHLLPRLYGYELMMAPYAVAHMKIGLKLADTGYDFSGVEEQPAGGERRPVRARVFLTNALEPAQDVEMQLAFMSEALAHEARAANDAKARARFTVVMGNPPYSGISKNMGAWIQQLLKGELPGAGTKTYYKSDGAALGERKLWLQDDYVKFIRLSQYLADQSAAAVVGLITNNGFLDNQTFRGMRNSLLSSFNRNLYIDLHGSMRKGETRSGGDENVFDIEQGVSISIFSKSPWASTATLTSDVFGTYEHKVRQLRDGAIKTQEIVPSAPLYTFKAGELIADPLWAGAPKISDVMPLNGSGVITARDYLAVNFDIASLQKATGEFLDPGISDEIIREKYAVGDNYAWRLKDVRDSLSKRKAESFEIRPIEHRPFDRRVITYDDNIVFRPKRDLMQHVTEHENIAFVTTRQTKDEWGIKAVDSAITHKALSAYDINSIFPLWIYGGLEGRRPNLAPAFTDRLAQLTALRFEQGSDVRTAQAERGDLNATFGARDVFDWIYATLHSPTYRERYVDFLKSDFAHVPLPKDCGLFADLVPLGTRLVALHLLDADALRGLLADPKVRFVSTGGEPRPGRFNKDVRRDASGRVYLNDQNWFATVPQVAWERWMGGYQPAQKWLKDRSEAGSKDKLKPGRLLTDDDILHYRRMIVALEETGKVMAEIDEVIARHGGWPDAFKGMKD
jgi:hypothetical protein